MTNTSKLNIYSITEGNFITSRNATEDEVYKMMEGTCYQKEIQCSYNDILFAIGSETILGGDGYKTDADWVIETPKGTATLYNWKNGKNYDEDGGLAVNEIDIWSIGGKTADVVRYVTAVIFN